MEGVAALKNGKYEEARLSFQQSYALKPAPAALRNLAATELKTGRYLDAARHFTTYLKTTKASEIDRPEVVQRGLAEAKAHCGMLLFETSVPGAEIAVDGETVGRTPLDAEPWLVQPGEHVVTAQLAGYQHHSERHLLEAGRTLRVSIALQPTRDEATPAIVPETSAPAPAATPPTPPPPPPIRTPNPADEPRPVPMLPPPQESTARVSAIPIAIGGAITIAGLAVGFGYSSASSASAQDRDVVLANIPGASPKCGSMTPHAAACGEAQRIGDKADAQRNLATAGFITAGVAATATLVYWLWPRSSRSHGIVVPAVAPAYAGVQWQSSF